MKANILLLTVFITLFSSSAFTWTLGMLASGPGCYINGSTQVTAILNPASQGHSVTFSVTGTGYCDPQTAITDSSGYARTYYHASTTTGPVTITGTTDVANGNCSVTVFEITQDYPLWWFNGETPTNYHTDVTLTAVGSSNGYFSWQIGSGPSAVFVVNGTEAVSVSLNGINTIILRSKGKSSSLTDLHVSLSWNSGIIHPNWSTCERAPYKLIANNPYIEDSARNGG